jgi:hypothetical protein
MYVGGQVEDTTTDQPDKWDPLQDGMFMPNMVQSRLIRTGAGSSVLLNFWANNVLMQTCVMGGDTKISFDTTSAAKTKIGVLSGTTHITINELIAPEGTDIATAEGILTIKQGTVDVSEKNGESVFQVIEGSADLIAGAGGKAVTLNGGEAATATKSGLSAKKKFDARTVNDGWKGYGAKGYDALMKSRPAKKGSAGSAIWIVIVIAALAVAAYKFLPVLRSKKTPK